MNNSSISFVARLIHRNCVAGAKTNKQSSNLTNLPNFSVSLSLVFHYYFMLFYFIETQIVLNFRSLAVVSMLQFASFLSFFRPFFLRLFLQYLFFETQDRFYRYLKILFGVFLHCGCQFVSLFRTFSIQCFFFRFFQIFVFIFSFAIVVSFLNLMLNKLINFK